MRKKCPTENVFFISMGSFFLYNAASLKQSEVIVHQIVETFAVNVMCSLRDGPLFDSGIRDPLITCSILWGPLMSKSVYTQGHQTGHDSRNHGQ